MDCGKPSGAHCGFEIFAQQQGVTTTAPAAQFFQTVELREVTLRVRDRATVRAFYADLLGLAVIAESDTRTELATAVGEPVLLVLESTPTAAVRPARTAGLFHTAFLLPDRAALGRMAQRLIERRVRFATGDHGVSEALYLDDPEGNGVELYADRALDAWPRSATDDEVAMFTRPVDLESLLEVGARQAGPFLPRSTRIGHVHLCVSDLARAAGFYVEQLGFVVRQSSFHGALFIGRDGYHHHLGLNTWQSNRPAVPGALGLAEFTLTYHSRTAWEKAVRTAVPGAPLRDPPGAGTPASGRRVRVTDPDGLAIVLECADF